MDQLDGRNLELGEEKNRPRFVELLLRVSLDSDIYRSIYHLVYQLHYR